MQKVARFVVAARSCVWEKLLVGALSSYQQLKFRRLRSLGKCFDLRLLRILLGSRSVLVRTDRILKFGSESAFQIVLTRDGIGI